LALGGLAGTLLAAGVGCSQNSSLIRGQSPDDVGIARAADRPAFPVFRGQSPDFRPKPSHNTKLVSHEGLPVSDDAFANGAVMSGGYCPPNACPPGGCPGGCPGMCLPGIPCPGIPCPGGACMGSTYTYRDPGMPVYPPGTGPALTGPGSPGAVVQYPYYTTKGPDDFFLDQDGRF
jgi:hypothetical protein